MTGRTGRVERQGVVVLGATGSIGCSTLAVLRRHPDRFRVVGLTARCRAEALDALALEFDPDFVVLADGRNGHRPRWTGEWRTGAGEVAAAATHERASIVVNGLVGIAGLSATLRALEAGKRLALANKESLVAGGELVLAARRRGSARLVPIDSEHSAIHQCLGGRPAEEVHRLTITASGGPFRTRPAAELADVRPSDALAHPTWQMGDKVTVDSATLANKALEVIEAHLLFGIDYDRIRVVVHPQSIVHSLVEFRDGSTLAQLGHPSMEVPILYALAGPERLPNEFRSLDPVHAGPLTFEVPRRDAFPLLDLGVEAGRLGGAAPAVFNAANEEAVRAFLDDELDFPGIAAVVGEALARCPAGPVDDVEDVWEADRRARTCARAEVRRRIPA